MSDCGHIDVYTPYGGAMLPFSCPFCVIDQLARQIKLGTMVSPENPPTLLEFFKTRYAREAEQWKANHADVKKRYSEKHDELNKEIELLKTQLVETRADQWLREAISDEWLDAVRFLTNRAVPLKKDGKHLTLMERVQVLQEQRDRARETLNVVERWTIGILDRLQEAGESPRVIADWKCYLAAKREEGQK